MEKEKKTDNTKEDHDRRHKVTRKLEMAEISKLSEEHDDLLKDALKIADELGCLSTGILKERLKIGKFRSNNIIETLISKKILESNSYTVLDEAIKLLEPAKKLAVESRIISTGFFQRHLHIDYQTSRKIIDVLERKGLIEAKNGAKPQRVILKKKSKFTMWLSRHHVASIIVLIFISYLTYFVESTYRISEFYIGWFFLLGGMFILWTPILLIWEYEDNVIAEQILLDKAYQKQ